MIYHGSCHCGRVAFALEGAVKTAMSRDCSLCARKGVRLSAVSTERFTLLTAPEASTAYHFDGHAVVHRFCKTCGVQPYSEHVAEGVIYINLNCIDSVDGRAIDSAPISERAA